MARKKVVTVGGGYVGFEVAKALDTQADITLIKPREAFVQLPAAIRALFQPGLPDQIILPYDRLLTHGRGIRGRATEVAQSGVTPEDGGFVPADYVVLATGSHVR